MRWTRFFERSKLDREQLDEMESYEQIETDENVARGMTYEEACAAARRKLGNRTLVREEVYKMNTLAIFERLARDARIGLRMLAKNPTFTAVALLTLAIGSGATIAVFSVVNSVLIKPLAYPDPDRLVAVWHAAPGAPGLASVSGDLRVSPSMYITYSEENRTFEALGVWAPIRVSVAGLAEPEQARAVLVGDGTLQALAVFPAAGRWLDHTDHKPGPATTVMLGYGYWQRRYGGDRSVIGQNITVDARPRQIVGVMPQGFRFLNTDTDLILPVGFDRSRLTLAGFGYNGIARLKPGVTIPQANADLARMLPIWLNSWSNGPGTNPHDYDSWRITPAIRPLKQDVTGNIGNVLWILMGTIGVVMLIACANVANLLLVRAEARQQELAVRAALGAGWGRIVYELLVESVLLGLCGGALGLAVAYGGLRLLLAIGPANLPRLAEISIDARALIFAVVVSLVSGMLFGLIPAWKYARASVAMGLRSGGRSSSQSRERHRTRSVLVVAQVALALLLLVCSGLMIRTFQALRRVQPGFAHAEQIQTMRISIPSALVADPERVTRIQNEIVDKLKEIVVVRAAAFSTELPMEDSEHNWDVVLTEDQPRGTEIPPIRLFTSISPGFFEVMGTKLVAGRDLTWTDIYGRRAAVLISENLARELWGSAPAALGKRVGTGIGSWREVIGVVENVRDNGLGEPAPAMVYWPSYGESSYQKGQIAVARTVAFAIRSERVGAESFSNQVRQAVWSVNRNLAVASMETMQEVYDRSLARTCFALVMLGIAGAMALVLGLVGIYGLISYAVSQRRREIGIRVALGARPGELGQMFLRYALGLAAIGTAIGLAASIGLTRLMRSLLFGVSPVDPVTFVVVPLVLVLAAVLASYLPARRAAAVDPVEALRAE
jgi:predicted permease